MLAGRWVDEATSHDIWIYNWGPNYPWPHGMCEQHLQQQNLKMRGNSLIQCSSPNDSAQMSVQSERSLTYSGNQQSHTHTPFSCLLGNMTNFVNCECVCACKGSRHWTFFLSLCSINLSQWCLFSNKAGSESQSQEVTLRGWRWTTQLESLLQLCRGVYLKSIENSL